MKAILFAAALAALMPLRAGAQQAAPFCLVNNFGQAQCFYWSLDACRSAAGTLGGMCSANPANAQQQPQQRAYDVAAAARLPNYAESMQQGYEAGARMRQQREAREQQQAEHEARMRLLEAQIAATEAEVPAPVSAPMPAYEGPQAQPGTLYKCYDPQGIPNYTGRAIAGLRCEIVAVYRGATQPPPQQTAQTYQPLQFRGYACTQDCSGHQAGYDWAAAHGIDEPENCGGRSQSFIEGCRAYAVEQQ